MERAPWRAQCLVRGTARHDGPTTGRGGEPAYSRITRCGSDSVGSQIDPVSAPASIAKGGRSREIRLPARLLHRLADYVAIERANALTNFHDVDSGSIAVADDTTRGAIGLADGTGQVRSVRLDVLSPAERRRLVTSSGEPMILWLNEAGRPMTSPAWAAVFRRASMRCRTLGIDLDVTPHALRHTFAVHMLSMLIREQIGAILADGPPDEPGSAAYRRMIGDPLQKLQRLLGQPVLPALTFI